MIFSETDKKQIANHELNLDEVNNQIEKFNSGFPYINIVRPATLNDGIRSICEKDFEKYANKYQEYAKNHKIIKFVPASGAATRMFKDLFDFISSGIPNETSKKTIANITKFAFWSDLKKYFQGNESDSDLIKYILTDSGLNYGNKPKGLIAFHRYKNSSKTPLEEHLTEAAQYAKSNDCVNVHFTVSPEYRKDFESLLNKIIPEYEQKYGLKYNVSISEQKKFTDTIAVNMDNTPFRNPDGSLLFRPSGHGALIANLNELDGDLIFIKNIDNVTTDSLRGDTIKYSKVLAGILVDLQEEIFKLLKNKSKDLETMHEFITNKLNVKLDKKLTADEYVNILNRPLRVCGVVKNTGAPGGGPFWVKDNNETTSLQIVESSQIAPESKDIMKESEFFNSVNLVCAIKDYNGKKFDLNEYIDFDTGFISEKSKNGVTLRAMERPGLWNGSMAKWNTVFIAIPITTFSPVKTVTDLLNSAHQTDI